MGLIEDVNPTAQIRTFMETFQKSSRQQFDQLVTKLRLDDTTLLSQTLEELEHSLEVVNQALTSYSVYNTVELSTSFGSTSVAKTTITAKMTIVPYLLKSKRLILSRIRALKLAGNGNGSNGSSF